MVSGKETGISFFWALHEWFIYICFLHVNKITIKEKGSLSHFKLRLIFLNIIKKRAFNLFSCHFPSIFTTDAPRSKILMTGNIDLICKLN